MNASRAESAIVARGLTRRFGHKLAVNGIDLEVPRAQIFGFLGPNGSGKSTTIRMLCGLLTPTAGDCVVLGQRMPEHADTVRNKIGYMTQRFALWEDLTVRENLEFMGRIYSLTKTELVARMDWRLDRYRLNDLAEQRAGTLSGGQKQRLALAAATLHEPELLLLDEPTSAVDPQSRRDFWESLFELVDAGTTILVSTHYMDEAERCHQLAILDEGKLVAHGAPLQLIEDIGASVVQVAADNSAAARAVLQAAVQIKAVTQLGNRLHVLVDDGAQSPAEYVREILAARNIQAEVGIVTASLEDVFVAATGFGKTAQGRVHD
ncbi:MAG: ABC transporter ATP-binding protein [Steroidobacteraceae bacterium]